MELTNLIAHGDIYDIYESEGKSINLYLKPEYKEKCLYAALTHAR